MTRAALFLAGAALLLASAGHSQTGDKKKSRVGEVEVSFANGSLVRMVLAQDNIEIETQYGKLSVPVRDIRRIDFGLHLPEGADKKIELAIKQLASAEFKERDAAMRELIAHGAHAYPALMQAARKGEPEVVKRAQDAIVKIRSQVPAKELQLGHDDKVMTPKFTIVGRITTPSFKAQTEYFGEVQLSPASLRHVRVLIEPRETEVLVDAAKYAAGTQWMDTGITVDRSANLAILASGELDLRPSLPGNYVCGPRGYARAAGFAAGGKKKGGGPGVAADPFNLGRAYPGTLLGRIGEQGETFVIGDRFDGPPERDGKLYLQIVSSPYDTAVTGTYQVKVSVRD